MKPCQNHQEGLTFFCQLQQIFVFGLTHHFFLLLVKILHEGSLELSPIEGFFVTSIKVRVLLEESFVVVIESFLGCFFEVV